MLIRAAIAYHRYAVMHAVRVAYASETDASMQSPAIARALALNHLPPPRGS
jgi:hypothetical protein